MRSTTTVLGRALSPAAMLFAAVLLAGALCLAGFDSVNAPAGARAQRPASSRPARSSIPSAGPASRPAGVLRLLTYNVLAGPNTSPQRVRSLMDLLDQSNADIIALQEVAPWILRVLDAQQWTRQYTRVAHHGRPVAPGGLHVMSRFPIKRASYKALPSRQGRGVLTVHLTANGRQLVVATVHLESPLTSTDKAARVKQMGLIWPLLAGAHDAVLMGDMNFGDRDQLETAALDKRFVDLWPVLKPKRPGFTWNMEVNPMAREGAFPGEKSRRLDRILLRSKFYRPASIKIIGSKPVSPKLPNLYPSDHFGLVCDLLIRQKDS